MTFLTYINISIEIRLSGCFFIDNTAGDSIYRGIGMKFNKKTRKIISSIIIILVVLAMIIPMFASALYSF